MQLARQITQCANAVSKPYGLSAVGLLAWAPIMHTKMAVITSLRFYFFQFLDTIFCAIFQKPPTFEATSRRSFEGRTHPHQRKETVLSHKYNAFCLVSLNFEHFLSLLDLNLSRYRSGIWSFYFLLLKNYTAGVKNTSTMYTCKPELYTYTVTKSQREIYTCIIFNYT